MEIESQTLGSRDNQVSQKRNSPLGQWFVRVKEPSLVKRFAQLKDRSRQDRTNQLIFRREELTKRLNDLEQKLKQKKPDLQVISKKHTAITGIFLSNNLSDAAKKIVEIT